MPAAAVIPAPVAYIKVVAVKKLVVGRLQRVLTLSDSSIRLNSTTLNLISGSVSRPFTLRKLECLKQAVACIPQLGIMQYD